MLDKKNLLTIKLDKKSKEYLIGLLTEKYYKAQELNELKQINTILTKLGYKTETYML